MRDIFISYVEEDNRIIVELAAALEAAGYSTWYYERDGKVGGDYLLETRMAIDQCQAFVLILSPHSITSKQVDVEVVRAHETEKSFIPLRSNLSHKEFAERQPKWAQVIGSKVTTPIPTGGVKDILPALLKGLKTLGVIPRPNATGPLAIPGYLLKRAGEATGKFRFRTQTVSGTVKAQPTIWKKYYIAAATLAVVIAATFGYRMMNGATTKPEVKTSEPNVADTGRPKIQSDTFIELFADRKLGKWKLPSPCPAPSCGWVVKNDWLYIENQPSLGYTVGDPFGDFQMQFNLKLTNAGGAAWALRVKNQHNYYLFYLAGPEAHEDVAPGYFYTYIVSNGNDNIVGDPVVIPAKLVAGHQYTINITATGNVITHSISAVNNSDGSSNSEEFAKFTDKSPEYYSYGGIGFRTIGSEKFSVAQITVTPTK